LNTPAWQIADGIRVVLQLPKKYFASWDPNVMLGGKNFCILNRKKISRGNIVEQRAVTTYVAAMVVKIFFFVAAC